MKKFILIATMLVSSTAFAGGFGAVEYSNRDGVNGKSDADAYKITVGNKFNDYLTGDFSLRQKTDDSDILKDTRLEAGATFSVDPIWNIKPYLRTAVGEKFTPVNDFTYFSVEPGVKLKITDNFSLKAGWRYRDAFDTVNPDKTRSLRFGSEYVIADNYYVGLGYDRVRGDSEYNAVNVSFGMKF